MHASNDSGPLLKAQALVLEENAKGRSLNDVLNILCIEAQSLLGQGAFNTILLLKGKALIHGAAPSLPAEYVGAINGLSIGPETGSCGTAAYSGRTVIVSEISQDALWIKYRQIAEQSKLISCWSTPIFSSDKKVLGTFATYYKIKKTPSENDISLISKLGYLAGLIIEKANSEEAVREREGKLGEAEYIARIGNYTWNIASDEITWSRGMHRLLGYDQTEIFDSKRVNTEIYHSQDRSRVSRWVKSGLSSGEERLPSIEYHLVCKNGEVICVHAEGKIEYKDGMPFKFFGTCLDITERKRFDKALRESEAKFRSLSENSQDYITRYDRQCRHLYQNQAAYRMSGIPKEIFLGKTHRELGFDEDLCDLWEKNIKTVFTTKEPVGELFEWESPSEGIICLDWRLFPELDKYGEVETVLSVSRDITENSKLEKQLVQSQKLEALGTLAGGIAHDFNNMLAIILGNAELLSLKLREIKGGSGHYLDEIKYAANRSADLAKQILTFSRMDVAELEPTDISLVVEDAIHLLRATIPTHIDIKFDVPEHSAKVLADKTQIHQIIVNLVTNAFHSMEESGGLLEVALVELECHNCSKVDRDSISNKDCLRLTIKDSGCGISQEDQSKIFDPFFTTKEVGKGTGLGLAMVYSIVQDHGGVIEIDSELNKGTTVNICFPLLDGPEGTAKEIIQTPAESSPEPRRGGHILVVEDEISLAEMYEEFLQGVGYVVSVCTNGSNALDLFRRSPSSFDLVLTDQAMPRMTGKQLCNELLQIRPDIPIILCTGYSGVLTEENVRSLGVCKYLIKPIQLNTLKQAIEDCLNEGIHATL